MPDSTQQISISVLRHNSVADQKAHAVVTFFDPGGRVALYSHDEAPRHGIEAVPFLIKLNQYELETVATEARALQQRSVEYVRVFLGDDGALWVG